MDKQQDDSKLLDTNFKIIKAFRGSNEKAFILVYKKLFIRVSIYLSLNGGNSIEANDLTWVTIEEFRKQCAKPEFSLTDKKTGNPIPFMRYVTGIYKNKWRENLKKKSKERPFNVKPKNELNENKNNDLLDNSGYVSTSETYAYKELLAYVISGIKMMSPKCRKLFYLHVFSNWSHKKIVMKTKITSSENSSQSKLYSCRQKLSRILNATLGDEWNDIEIVKKFLSRNPTKRKK